MMMVEMFDYVMDRRDGSGHDDITIGLEGGMTGIADGVNWDLFLLTGIEVVGVGGSLGGGKMGGGGGDGVGGCLGLLLLLLLLGLVACLETFFFRGGMRRLSTCAFPCAPLIQFLKIFLECILKEWSFCHGYFTLRFPLVVKAFWHTEHTKGRSPVCVLMWIWSADVDEKFFVHTLHTCFDDESVDEVEGDGA